MVTFLVMVGGMAAVVWAGRWALLFRAYKRGRAREVGPFGLVRQWPSDLMAVVRDIGPDYVQAALQREGRYPEECRYSEAKQEIWHAYLMGRVPAPWAQSLVLAYRDAYALAAELEAERVRQEVERLRKGAGQTRPPRTVHAEVVRPRHSQLPN